MIETESYPFIVPSNKEISRPKTEDLAFIRGVLYNIIGKAKPSRLILRTVRLLSKPWQSEAFISIAQSCTPKEIESLPLSRYFSDFSFQDLTIMFIHLDRQNIPQENLRALIAHFPNYLSEKDPAREGKTALHFACDYDQPELVRILLSLGGDPLVKDDYGLTPIASALSKHRFSIISVFKELSYKDHLNLCETYLSQEKEDLAKEAFLKTDLFQECCLFDDELPPLPSPKSLQIDNFPNFEKLLEQKLSSITLDHFYKAIALDFEEHTSLHQIEYDFDILISCLPQLFSLYGNERVTTLYSHLNIIDTGISTEEVFNMLPKSKNCDFAFAITKALGLHFSFIEDARQMRDIKCNQGLSDEDLIKEASAARNSIWASLSWIRKSESTSLAEFMRTEQGQTVHETYLAKENPYKRFKGVLQALLLVEELDDPKQQSTWLNNIAASVIQREHYRGLSLGGECESLLQRALEGIPILIRHEFLRYVYLWSDQFLEEKTLPTATVWGFNEQGETPLTFSAKHGFTQMTQWLLKQEESHPRQVNSKGQTVSDILKEKERQPEFKKRKKISWEKLVYWHTILESQQINTRDYVVCLKLRDAVLIKRVCTLFRDLKSVKEREEFLEIQTQFFEDWSKLKSDFRQKVFREDLPRELLEKTITHLFELDKAQTACQK